MAKEPMRLSEEAKMNMMGYGGIPAMAVATALGNNPGAAAIGGAAVGAIGAGVGLAKTAIDTIRARKRAELVRSVSHHPALGRQFRDN